MKSSLLSISAENLVYNALTLKDKVGSYYCVLKSDAYGHGATLCASALYEAGMRHFAVFSLDEALEIKPYVNGSDVLILGRTPSRYAEILKRNSFIQTVFSSEYANELLPFAKGLRLHIKLDTGMNRSGFRDAPKNVYSAVSGLKGAIEGVYTHFHCADADSLSVTVGQLEVFKRKACELETLLSKTLTKHTAASAAALRLEDARMDLCRIGLALYGCLPDNCEKICELKPVMSFSAPVISVRDVKKGENIGYGCDRIAKSDITVATASVGYANGLSRAAEQLFRPMINGRRVGFVGRICMDRCMLDVTGIDVKPYDTVELFGKNISVCELSCSENTISYEVLTRVGRMNAK